MTPGRSEFHTRVDRALAEGDAEKLWRLSSLGRLPSAARQLIESSLGRFSDALVKELFGKGSRDVRLNVTRALVFGSRRELGIELGRLVVFDPAADPIERRGLLGLLFDEAASLERSDLRALVGGESRDVRNAAAHLLAFEPAEHDWLLARVEEGLDPTCLVSGFAESEAGTRVLIELALGETDGAMLARALGVLGPRSSEALVLRGLEDEQPQARAMAIEAAVGLEGAYDIAIAALRDPAADVRRAALSALVKIGDVAALEAMRALLRDPDPQHDRHNPYPVSVSAETAIERLKKRLGLE